MKNIAIITARGGSKRIPRKNIKNFCGEPIIAYSIEAALKSGIFNVVMVSTDDEEIASIARAYGAEVPFMRSEATSNDFSTTADVLNEVLNNYARESEYFNSMCCIYPTAPFVTDGKLCSAYDKLSEKKDADIVMPVVSYSFPPQRGLINQDGKLLYWKPEFRNSRSQDLEPIYHDAGQFYFYRIFDRVKFKAELITPFFVQETEVQDIDNEVDWKLAEAKYKTFIQERNYLKGSRFVNLQG